MALPLSRIFPLSQSSSPSNPPKFPRSNISFQIKLKPTSYSISITKSRSIIPKSTQESTNTNASEAESQNPETEMPKEDKDKSSSQDGQLGNDDDEASQLGAEIKKVLKERAEKEEKPGFLSGVAEEIGEIEWPAFGKVLGTTGVVLGVIAGSSVVLLTVNAVLAELSDRVFVAKGIQDFFS